jgi:hypothetical protein
MEAKSTLELKIHKFVLNYGPETLIYWLDHFSRVISIRDYPLYRNLERQACKSCDIAYADLQLLNNTQSTNAKRIISFVAVHQLHVAVPSISKLLNVCDRTINYYLNDAEDWINAPNTNRVFVDAYKKTIEALPPLPVPAPETEKP